MGTGSKPKDGNMKRFPVPVHGNIRSLLAVTSGWRGPGGQSSGL